MVLHWRTLEKQVFFDAGAWGQWCTGASVGAQGIVDTIKTVEKHWPYVGKPLKTNGFSMLEPGGSGALELLGVQENLRKTMVFRWKTLEN